MTRCGPFVSTSLFHLMRCTPFDVPVVAQLLHAPFVLRATACTNQCLARVPRSLMGHDPRRQDQQQDSPARASSSESCIESLSAVPLGAGAARPLGWALALLVMVGGGAGSLVLSAAQRSAHALARLPASSFSSRAVARYSRRAPPAPHRQDRQ